MTTEWMNNSSSEYIEEESYPTSTTSNSNFQYINEDTCTSTATTTTTDDPIITTKDNDDTAAHAEIILNYFQQLYQSQKGIDLEIFLNGISVAKVHRIVIASFLRMLNPVIDGINSAKLDIPNSIGVSIDDLREIINFLYTGKIVIKNRRILKSLDELGCNHILPLLYDVLEDDDAEDQEETVVEDKYHSINLMNKLKEFCDENRFIDCSLKLENGIEVKCHRYCIAAFSKIVEDSLEEVENTHQIIYLEITELGSTSIKAVNHLVKFIYSNKIPSDISDYGKLKETALIFGVERLIQKLPSTATDESNEEEYYEETTSYYDDDSNSATEVTTVTAQNLIPATEYVTIYNQFVEGPTTASCSTIYYDDPTVEFISSSSPTKPLKSSSSLKLPRYKCSLCNFVSPFRGTIQKHIRSIHTHETPYSCPHCFMAFKIQSNFSRHLRSHSQIKPYKCKSCGFEYADKKNMDAHIFRVHLKREPFRCPHNCAKAKFYREDSWRRHCQKFHSNLPAIAFPTGLTEEDDVNSQNGSEEF